MRGISRLMGTGAVVMIAHPLGTATVIVLLAVLAARGVMAAAQTVLVGGGLAVGLHIAAPRLMRGLGRAGRRWSTGVMDKWRRHYERRRQRLYEQQIATSISDGMALRDVSGGEGR